MEFLASLCSDAMEKSPCQSLLARCPKCLFPNFMVESSRSCQLIFEKILISYKQLPSREANAEKLESSNFLSTSVKENKDSFVKFDKETDCFDTFIWHFFLDHFFVMLQKVLKMLMILSHGQDTVAKGDLVLMVNFWLKIFTRKV